MNKASHPTPERDLEEALRRSTHAIEIWVEKRRYGKEVTVLSGFEPSTDLAELARELKQQLAVGGSAKDGRIELQGDQRARARTMLSERGMSL